MDFVVQNLIEEKEVLYFNCSGKFDISKLEDICIALYPPAELSSTIPKLLKRLKVINIMSSKELHDFVHILKAILLLFPKLALIIIDDHFYDFDAYVSLKTTGKSSRLKYIQSHERFLKEFSKTLKITIVFTRPSHRPKPEYPNDIEDAFRVRKKIRKRAHSPPIKNSQSTTSSDEDQKKKKRPTVRNRIQPDIFITLSKTEGPDVYNMHVVAEKKMKECKSNTTDKLFKIENHGLSWQ
jgi:hypothetical protein